MFTGIIEKIARVASIRPVSGGARLAIDLGELAEGARLGDSIAVNGACLTVGSLDGTTASFDVVAETLRRTNLGKLAPGQSVNLERALRLGDRLGGHFVQGHIDGVGAIAGRTLSGGEHLLRVSVDPGLADGMIEKGSVAIDGVSLTIAALSHDSLTVALVPHTLRNTTLDAKPDGSPVNIEVDVIGKYVRKLLGHQRGGLTEEFLREHGF